MAWLNLLTGPYARAAALLCLFAALGVVLAPWLGEGYVSLVFVLAISLAGTLYGMTPALVASLLGAFLFDFFISEPVFEFSLDRTADLAPPLVFTLCAVISGWLSGRLKDEAIRANRSNRQLESLLDLSRALQSANSEADVAGILGADGRRYSLLRAAAQDGAVVAGALADPAVRSVAQAAMTDGREMVEKDDLVACRLDTGGRVLGALVAEKDAAGEDGLLLARARMGALVLERIELGERLGEVRAKARSEELKSALLASVSHDLRSPLTAISTSAASLLEYGEQFDSETSRELLSGIVAESSRLNHLTANLLQMTRLQAGQEELYWTDLPVADTLRAVVERKRRLDDSHPIRLVAPDEDVLVRADTALFDLVITNVLQNAARYSPVGTPITITCGVEGELCAIAITDEGIGIPPEEQSRVFDSFYRGERGDRKPGGSGPAGSGLGLAIARGFVNACGGAIAVTSPVKDGQGTTITIHLPLTRNEAL